MKILFILENYLPHIGGVEIVFQNLIRGLVKHGHEVAVLTHRLPGTKKFEVLDSAAIHRIRCFDSRYLFTFFAVPKAIQLAKDSDLIHTTSFNAGPPAWLASVIRKKPVLITVHEVWISRWRQLTSMGWIKAFIHDLLERMIYWLPYDAYACVSQSTLSQLLEHGIGKQNASVVYNGIDYTLWNPKLYNKAELRQALGMDGFTILCSGRPGVSKGIEYAVRAMAAVKEKIKDAKLLLILSKDPAYKKEYLRLVALIDELRLADGVMLHDPVPYADLPKFVAAADCVVIPSIAEGFCFAAAEASALGTPVVASDTTSLPEVVSNGYVLVKPKDTEDIARGIVAVHEKKYRSKPLKKFTWEENVKAYVMLYEKLLG